MVKEYSHDRYIELIKERKNAWDNPALKYKNDFVPDCVYKYWSLSSPNIDRNLEALVDGKIWMPVAQTLNDPFEFQMITDKLSETERIMFRGDILGRNSVLSLAPIPCNYLMWSHYGNSHTGACLEFEVESKDEIFPVTYVESQIDATCDIREWLTIKERVMHRMMSKEDMNSFEWQLLEKVRRIMLYKHSIWGYENEFRIIGRKEICAGDEVRIPKGYLENLSDVGLRLKRIILGFNCRPEDKIKVLKCVNQINSELVIRELMEKEYRVNVEEVVDVLARQKEFVEVAQFKREGTNLKLDIVDLNCKNYVYEM